SIKSVSKIYPQWTERGHERRTKSSTAEQPRRVKVPRPLPEVSSVVKAVDIQLLTHTNAELDRTSIVRITEGTSLRLKLVGVRDIAFWRDRELLVSAQGNSVLDTAE